MQTKRKLRCSHGTTQITFILNSTEEYNVHINAVIHDTRRTQNQTYAYSPTVDAPRTVDIAQWSKVTVLSTKSTDTLVKEQVTITYPTLRGLDKPRTRTITAYTNATHTRHARNKRAPIIR